MKRLIPALFGLSLLFTLMSAVLVRVSYKDLPPEIPLWYTREAISLKLSPPQNLNILPGISLVLLAVNAAVALVLTRKREPTLTFAVALLTLALSISLGLSAFQVVNLAGLLPRPSVPEERSLTLLLLGAVISLAITVPTIRVGQKLRLIDHPHGPYPDVRPLVRLGGLVIFLAFWLPVIILVPLDRSLIALLLGSLVLVLVGFIDDWRNLPPPVLLVGQIAAALILIGGGVAMSYVRNPLSPFFGGAIIPLDFLKIGPVAPLPLLFTLLWVVALINIVNWLDGADGLAGGVGFIAALTLFAISHKFGTHIPQTLSLILAGSLLGFLPFNIYPAKIILGSGAYLLGFLLAALSIHSDGRAATALLVLSLPALDTTIVLLNRFREKAPLTRGDRKHLHHRLLAQGFSVREVVALEWFLCLLLGAAALLLPSVGKFFAIGLIFALGIAANQFLGTRRKEETGRESPSQKAGL